MTFIRQGECNRCGQCCGAEGSPNQANPWPKNWFEMHQAWDHDHFASVWPYASMFGVAANASGKPEKQQEHGNFRINVQGGQPRRVYWTWVDGRPCKDISSSHDGSEYSLECPALMDDPGDGSRPCALVGSMQEEFYQRVCYPEGPERFHDQRSVDQWTSDHPMCSYTWIEE